jgi:cyclomaltodextrinase
MGGADWFRHAIIYHILIDRFAGFTTTNAWDTPQFLGGNLKGIIKALPYLKDLGVNTLWISPFYKTSAYHGYHITDFYDVDPRFGTKDDLNQLISTVHNNSMYIIADFVPNHCSRYHPYFQEAQKDKSSPFYDWFFFTHWPTDYLCFLSVRELPKLNLQNPEVQDHIIKAAFSWLSYGFDGFRLDHVIGPPHQFWKQFRHQVKSKYPNAVIIGEAWMQGIRYRELDTINIRWKHLKWLLGSSSDSLFKEYYHELDGVLDFRVQEILRDNIARHVNTPHVEKLLEKLRSRYRTYAPGYYLPTFLDNHDMDRFLFECKGNIDKLKQAATLQFLLPQPPIIYYGTEIGMSQQHSLWDMASYGDLQARQPMQWHHQNKQLLDFYKKLIKERKNRDIPFPP